MFQKGRENFQNQLKQLIGSIQYSNDLDVHVALIVAPSFEKTQREKYFGDVKTNAQICREFVDLFGFMQKNQNGLDLLIEESKLRLKTWGGPMPNFLMCNSKLNWQLTMIPEVTSYVAQGPDGVKRLKQGPEIQSYRGLKIVPSRAFSMETGVAPRDIMRRRVRVAEYYRIPPNPENIGRFDLPTSCSRVLYLTPAPPQGVRVLQRGEGQLVRPLVLRPVEYGDAGHGRKRQLRSRPTWER